MSVVSFFARMLNITGEKIGDENMNICVYGSADMPGEKCLQVAKALGSYIGKNGHTLVFGGFGDGLLGVVADEAWKSGAKVISVLPEAPRKGHSEFLHSAQVFRDSDKRMRKKIQTENADAFVVMPEGLGVLDELFEVLLLKQYGEDNKPIYIVNIEHKYDLLISLLKEQNCEALFTVIAEEEFQKISISLNYSSRLGQRG